MEVCRENIDLANVIAVRLKPTGRTPIVASPGFVAMGALWARLARMVLVLQHHPDTFRFGFVRNIGAYLAVIPLARTLVVHGTFVDPIGNIADVAIDDGTGLAIDRFLNNGVTDFVLHVPHDHGILGTAVCACSHKLLVLPTAFFLARQGDAQSLEMLGMSSLLRASCAARNHRSTLRIANDRRVNLSRIHTYRVAARRRLWRFAILDHDMPGIAPGALVEHQPHFLHLEHSMQCLW